MIPVGTPEDNIATSEFVSAVCGFPIVATTARGHIIIHIFQKSTGVVEIDNYNLVKSDLRQPCQPAPPRGQRSMRDRTSSG